MATNKQLYEEDLKVLGLEQTKLFLYKRRLYAVSRHSMGHLCGYVELGSVNAYRAENEIVCHGGVTYRGDGEFINRPGRPFIGFDCAHAGDYSPSTPPIGEVVYRDVAYVQNECRSIINQLIAMEEENETI